MNEEEQFSEDPIEHLKIENEILKLKLKAQYGENFQMFQGDEPLPPEVENQFLKNMINFEEQIKNIELVTVRERLGNPVFEDAASISDFDIEEKVNEILNLLDENSIEMGFIYEPINSREVYIFLTTEFMELEIEKFPVADMVSNFIYEEFKPNYQADVTENFKQFIKSWLEQNIDDIKYLLSDNDLQLGLQAEKISKDALVKKAENFIDSFVSFEEVTFEFLPLVFDTDKLENGSNCDITGNIEYNAQLETGEKMKFKGNVHFRYVLSHGYWDVAQITLPGLTR